MSQRLRVENRPAETRAYCQDGKEALIFPFQIKGKSDPVAFVFAVDRSAEAAGG